MSQAIFKDPYVSIAPVLVGTGNGTLTVDRLTHFTINQKYTAICTAVAPFTVFTVVGDKDGPVGVAVVGTQFYDQDLKVFFTIQQGPTLFVIGDKFEFTVAQGTDLNNANIDTYDELPQKNFSAGTNGLNSGDDNFRFTNVLLTAKLRLQDLLFTSLLAEELGNFIQIEYAQAQERVDASLVIQDLTFDSLVAGAAGNGISVEYEEAQQAVQAELDLGGVDGINYLANTPGAAGNNITIEYTDGAPTSTPIVSVLADAITIQIQDGITTVQEILDEIDLVPAAIGLITPTALGSAFAVVNAPVAATNLTGGLDANGLAGFEVVSVLGQAIKVILEGGVSTAQMVKDAIDAFPAAAALVAVSISGTAGNFQTTPVAPTNLTGGLDDLYTPGNELVEVIGTKIRVTFQSGESTATQIRTAILANSDAAALVSITIPGTAGNFQTVAGAKQFLSGGSPSDNWALNINELTAPISFYEGSGNLLINELFVQGIANFRRNVKMTGLLALDDIDAEENESGLSISNVQRAINQILAQLQITAILGTKRVKISGVDISLLDGRLLSQEIAKKIMLFSGAQIDFVTGNIYEADGTTLITTFTPVAYTNGQWQWYSIALQPTTAVGDNRMPVEIMLQAATGTGITKEAAPKANFIGARSIGQVAVLGAGGTIANITNANIRQLFPGGSGSAIGFQETPTGAANGLNTNFTLSKLPSDDNSIIVTVNGLIVPRNGYTVSGQVITFLSGWIPESCQEVYCWYLTDGSPAPAIVASGQEVVEYRTITLAEAAAKQLVLSDTPADPLKVKLDVLGGSPQKYGDDFTVVGNVVEWSGLGLDQIPTEENDEWRICYFN